MYPGKTYPTLVYLPRQNLPRLTPTSLPPKPWPAVIKSCQGFDAPDKKRGSALNPVWCATSTVEASWLVGEVMTYQFVSNTPNLLWSSAHRTVPPFDGGGFERSTTAEPRRSVIWSEAPGRLPRKASSSIFSPTSDLRLAFRYPISCAEYSWVVFRELRRRRNTKRITSVLTPFDLQKRFSGRSTWN